LAPLIENQPGEFWDVLEKLRREGFVRARIDGQMIELDRTEPIRLKKSERHTIEAVVDRLVARGFWVSMSRPAPVFRCCKSRIRHRVNVSAERPRGFIRVKIKSLERKDAISFRKAKIEGNLIGVEPGRVDHMICGETSLWRHNQRPFSVRK
jgi:excinuclease UvrABC ATPase subunit